MKNKTFENSVGVLLKLLKEKGNQNLEDQVMIQIVDFNKYPKEILNDILDEMLKLNSEYLENDALFPLNINTKKKLKEHIEKGYNPNEYFECWSNKIIDDFSLIPKSK